MKKVWKPVFEEGDAEVPAETATNELIPATVVGGDVAKYDDSIFDSVSKAGDYLPRLQLMTANSDPCKAGEFPVNNYAVVDGNSLIDLGNQVDVLNVAWRPKALEMGEEVISAFDPKDKEFARIQEKSMTPNSGCMFGPEFLVWIPQIKKWATFFMGSKSARRESPNVKSKMRQAVTLKSKKIESPKYTWFAPLATACSTPFDLPAVEEIQEQANKFMNPPATEIEKVDEATEGEERAT